METRFILFIDYFWLSNLNCLVDYIYFYLFYLLLFHFFYWMWFLFFYSLFPSIWISVNYLFSLNKWALKQTLNLNWYRHHSYRFWFKMHINNLSICIIFITRLFRLVPCSINRSLFRMEFFPIVNSIIGQLMNQLGLHVVNLVNWPYVWRVNNIWINSIVS